MAGETEVDEPLAVEGAGHRFQNLDAPLVVFDKFVVGRQDACNTLLVCQRGKHEFEIENLLTTNMRHVYTSRNRSHVILEALTTDYKSQKILV